MRMLLIFLCLTFIPQAMAGENTSAVIQGDFTSMKHTSSARVEKVIDAQTILMKDNKIVRLLGIGYPVPAGEDSAELTIEAKEYLEKILPAGTEVLLYQKRMKDGRSNRMDHALGHLVNKRSGEWINGALVAEGFAWTETDRTNPDMAEQLYPLEQKAREAGLGLWAADSPYGVLEAEDAQKGEGSFRIVEGTVNRAATNKNNLYLNFGSDWRTDFSVMIPPDIRKSLSRKGIDPMALSGKKIRVRGWLRHWNGPFMRLETVERMEMMR